MFSLGPMIAAGVFFALLIGGFSGFTAVKRHYLAKGETVVVERSKEEGVKINEKVQKRTSAIKPGTAASELYKRYSRPSE